MYEIIDALITIVKVRDEINRLKNNTATGPDRASNKMLRNLNDESIRVLTGYMQRCWDSNELPAESKTANLAFIPKPAKEVGLENQRAISITS